MKETVQQEGYMSTPYNAPAGYAAPQNTAEEEGEQNRWGKMQSSGSDSYPGYAAPQGNAAPQGYTMPQGYAAAQGNAMPQGYATPQAYAAPQGYAVPQGGHPVTPVPMADLAALHLGYPQYMNQPMGPRVNPAGAPGMGSNIGSPMYPGMPQANPEAPSSCAGYETISMPPQYPGNPYAGAYGAAQPFLGMPSMPFGPQTAYAPQQSSGQSAGFIPQQPFTAQQMPHAAPGAEACGCNHGSSVGAPGPQGMSGGFGGMPGFDPMAFAAQFGGVDPKNLENRYGQIIDMCNDFMQGKTDPVKIAGFLSSSGTHFWKGAIVGAALAFIMTNSSVKKAMGDSVSAIFGKAKPDTTA